MGDRRNGAGSEGTQEEKKRQRLGAAAWEMLSLSTYAIGDLSMAFVLEGYFVEKF